MKFLVTLNPDVVERLPEPTKAEILSQLPAQLERESARLNRFRERLDKASAEHHEFAQYLARYTAEQALRHPDFGEFVSPLKRVHK